MGRTRSFAVICALALLTSTMARASDAGIPGEIGPALSITGNGRLLTPAGRMTVLGDFPTGGALSPDGRFYWAVDSGHGQDDVQVVDVATGKVVQTMPLPGAYGGITYAPDGRTVYVSGEPTRCRLSSSRRGRVCHPVWGGRSAWRQRKTDVGSWQP